MNIYLLGLVVALLSFSLQIWPRLIKRYFGVDTWRWLFFADYVRKHKSLPKSSPKNFIVSSTFGYPPLIILLLSLFPKKFLEEYQFIFSPFFDLLNNYFIFLAGLFLTGDVRTAVLAQIIAALTPIIIIEASNLNTRIISYLIFTVSFLVLLMFTLTGTVQYFILAIIGLFVLFFTHRFGVQAYLVCAVGFSLIEKNPFYLLFFLMVFCLVYVIGGNLYRAIFNEHIASLKYWADKIDFRFAHQFRGLTMSKKQPDFIQQMYSLSIKSPLAYIIANNPWLLVFFSILLNIRFGIFRLTSALNIEELNKFEIWALSLIVWGTVVLVIKRLRNLGEGQRYLEYCVLPISIVIASFASPFFHRYGLVSYLCLFCIVSIMVPLIMSFQYKIIVLDRARSINKEVWDIIRYINTHDGKNIRLAMFPLQLGDAILYFTKCSILTSDLFSGLEKLIDLFPVLRVPLVQIIKKYKITHIFFDRKFVRLDELKLTNYKIIFDKNNYVLLKVE